MEQGDATETPQPNAIFRKDLELRKHVKNICFACVGQRDFVVHAANMLRLISSVPATYTIVGPAAIKLL